MTRYEDEYENMQSTLKWIAATPPLPNEGDEAIVNLYREIARRALPPHALPTGSKDT